jgi:murein L,D-transpeptidase YcbB/YkuD
MRAVIGRPDAQTYVFTDRIKEVIYNPYWNVPRSIVINEMRRSSGAILRISIACDMR